MSITSLYLSECPVPPLSFTRNTSIIIAINATITTTTTTTIPAATCFTTTSSTTSTTITTAISSLYNAHL